MTLSAFIAIYFVHLAAAISPGPAVVMAARTALGQGFARGNWLAVGIGLGACFWALAALFGLSVLFRVAPGLMLAMKFAGAAYLIWIAYKMWRHAPEPLDQSAAAADTGRGPLGLIWQGIAVQLANPKPAVFFGTIFLTFVPPHAPLWALGVILLIVFINDAGWNVIVARIFSLERTRAGYLNLKTVIDRTFGGLLALLGVKLAMS
jgi:threonine/homoserine/homoserine lactone efflux protein